MTTTRWTANDVEAARYFCIAKGAGMEAEDMSAREQALYTSGKAIMAAAVLVKSDPYDPTQAEKKDAAMADLIARGVDSELVEVRTNPSVPAAYAIMVQMALKAR